MDDKPYQASNVTVTTGLNPRPEFQLTIKGLLWAMFWLALSCVAWITMFIAMQVRGAGPALILAGSSLFLGCATPCIAIGALLGRPWIGAAVGISVGSLAIIVGAAWVMNALAHM